MAPATKSVSCNEQSPQKYPLPQTQNPVVWSSPTQMPLPLPAASHSKSPGHSRIFPYSSRMHFPTLQGPPPEGKSQRSSSVPCVPRILLVISMPSSEYEKVCRSCTEQRGQPYLPSKAFAQTQRPTRQRAPLPEGRSLRWAAVKRGSYQPHSTSSSQRPPPPIEVVTFSGWVTASDRVSKSSLAAAARFFATSSAAATAEAWASALTEPEAEAADDTESSSAS
mmetsp:Transcript_147786/g.474393  ORF Transcript_147786/g.474393 Transcript_147786/m.474393 type:complete len:223 (-) Transcript_147786:214-882(-)